MILLGKSVNSICGAIKRELGRTVPQPGHVLPQNRLSTECMKYVKARSIDHQAHVEVLLKRQVACFPPVLYLFCRP
jgi:hypothetical protein